MKTECNVVLDLLPLYIDGAVSDESKTVVEEHLKACPACDTACADMRSRMDAAQPMQAETAAMNQAAHTLRKRRRRRVWRNVLIGLVIGVTVGTALLMGLGYLRDNYHPIPLETYQISLYKLPVGETSMTDTENVVSVWHLDDTPCWTGRHYKEVNENGRMVMYMAAERPTLPYRVEGLPRTDMGDHWTLRDGLISDCEEIRQGTPEDYVTLWRKGDELPEGSDEMLAYIDTMYRLGNAVVEGEWPSLHGWPETSFDGATYTITYQVLSQEEYDALNAEWQQLNKNVPEWN